MSSSSDFGGTGMLKKLNTSIVNKTKRTVESRH